MKNCRQCGQSNDDGNQFCIGCGAVFYQEQAPPSGASVPPPFPTQPPMTYHAAPVPFSYGYPTSESPENPASLRNIRELAASSLMLTLAAIWLGQVAVSILIGIVNRSLFSQMIGAAPTLLIGMGLLMTWLSAKDEGQRTISPSGFSMIRTITIVQLVFVCIGVFAMLILAVFLLAAGFNELLDLLSQELELGSAIGVLNEIFEREGIPESFLSMLPGILLFIVLIGGAMLLVFFVMLLKFLGSVLRTLRTGVPQESCATPLAVLCFIIGAFSLLGLLSAPAYIITNPSPVSLLTSFASSGLGVAMYIIMGILLMKYKSAVYSRH